MRACDFFSKKVWTRTGLVDVFVLFFLHVGSRHVHLAGVTARPHRAWVTHQARNFLMEVGELSDKLTILLRDHDTKFVPRFDAVFEAEGARVQAVGPLAPNLNACAERWVQSVQQEYLDRFVAFGEGHLWHLVSEYADYYNRQRPRQAFGNKPPSGGPPRAAGAVVCEERLGGLLGHYRRVA